MRTFSLWLLGALLGLGGFAGGYHFHLESNPRRLLVVVDSSAPMRPVWERVRRRLDALAARRYTVFALASERDMLSLWSPHLSLGTLRRPAGERDFAALFAADNHLPPPDAIDEIVVITDADEVAFPSGWRRLAP